MNHKPQTLPCFSRPAICALLTVSVLPGLIWISAAIADEKPKTADPADAAPADPGGITPPAGDAAGLPSAQDILTQSRGKLEGLDSLQCELHQLAVISGMKLRAVGKYAEASGNRVSLQFQVFPLVSAKAEDSRLLALDAAAEELNPEDSRGILTQVSDGNVLYTSWKNGDTTRVTRRNIRDILAAALTTTAYSPASAAMDLGVGGLRGLISRLQTTMDFAPVKSLKAGDRTVLEVTGKWNDRIRKEVFQLPEGTVTDPRPQVPEYVRLYVDAETMLPRRIQFLKRSLDPAQKMVRPLITLDLRNLVLNQPVSDDLFAFKAPENVTEEDLTQQVIQMIEQSAKAAAEGADGTNASATDAPGAENSPQIPPGGKP